MLDAQQIECAWVSRIIEESSGVKTLRALAHPQLLQQTRDLPVERGPVLVMRRIVVVPQQRQHPPIRFGQIHHQPRPDMVAVLEFLQRVPPAQPVFGSRLDHKSQVDTQATGKLVHPVDPVVRVILHQSPVVFGPAVFLSAPLQHHLVERPQLHQKILFERGVGKTGVRRSDRCLRTEDTPGPALLGCLQRGLGQQLFVDQRGNRAPGAKLSKPPPQQGDNQDRRVKRPRDHPKQPQIVQLPGLLHPQPLGPRHRRLGRVQPVPIRPVIDRPSTVRRHRKDRAAIAQRQRLPRGSSRDQQRERPVAAHPGEAGPGRFLGLRMTQTFGHPVKPRS